MRAGSSLWGSHPPEAAGREEIRPAGGIRADSRHYKGLAGAMRSRRLLSYSGGSTLQRASPPHTSPARDPHSRLPSAADSPFSAPTKSTAPAPSRMRRVLIQAALLAPFLVGEAGATVRGSGRVVTEVVEIKTSDGQALEATFYKPVSGRPPAVILVHDAGASRIQLEPVADKLSKQGFGVLTLDLRGHGGSKTAKFDWDKFSEADKKSAWSFTPRDLDAAAEWLLGQPTIHSTSLSLVAYGSGCAIAVRHAKGDENVVCMALLAPNAADYGFDVRADIQTLVGLPTFVVTPKDDEAERMAQDANASSGNPYVELLFSPPKLTTPLDDKALPAKVTKWVAEKAMPKKGK